MLSGEEESIGSPAGVDREILKNLVEKVKKTEKRCMRMFNMEDLEMLCQQEDVIRKGSQERT